jgi:radical SAM superfamily enzyme YgiQ (UPF0313 family)
MRILLVLSPMFQHDSHLLASTDNEIPIGICYLGAVLEKAGHSVKILDGQLFPNTKQELQNILKGEKFDAVGISAVTPSSTNAARLAAAVKEINPKILTILGGVHATVTGPNVLEKMSNIDLAVFNEGEITIVEIMEHLEGKRRIESINGIAFRRDNKIIQTDPRKLIEDLDSLPYPAYHLIDIHKYTPPPGLFFKLPIISMVASRGCPFRCTFCADRIIWQGRYRFRKPKAVVDEMEFWKNKYDVKEIKFLDSTFTIGKERIKEFCNELIKRNLGLLWRCSSRVDQEDFDLLTLMKKSGCCSISFGIESGDNEILKKMNKNITVEQIKQTVKWSKQAGIETKGFFMLNYPGETEKTTEKTIRFSRELDLDFAGFNLAFPLEGTQMKKEIEENCHIEPKYWNNPDTPIGNQIYFYQDELPIEYLKKAYKRAVLGFYLQPKVIYRNLKKINNFAIFKSYLKGLLRLLKLRATK